jgi:hypothetical protein
LPDVLLLPLEYCLELPLSTRKLLLIAEKNNPLEVLFIHYTTAINPYLGPVGLHLRRVPAPVRKAINEYHAADRGTKHGWW